MRAKPARQVYDVVGPVEEGSSPDRCAQLVDFITTHRPARCLKLGFAHGVSTCCDAALKANGQGSLTSVDNATAAIRDSSAERLLSKTGLRHRVELIYEQTSYTWYLRSVVRTQLRGASIEPLYHFCFLDGAHSWAVDGFALLLVERLLTAGRTIVLDDLTWNFDDRWPDMSADERALAHVTEGMDLVATPNPAFDEVRVDGDWAWLRKSSAEMSRVRTVTRQDWVGPVRSTARVALAKTQRRLRGLVGR